jgi:predicted TIM-barrel fold metal-dependent hydrolase
VQVCDVHCHFFSSRFLEILAKDRRDIAPGDHAAVISTLLGWDPPGPPDALADRWIAELDRHQIARAAVIASIPGDEESVATAIARHPARLVGFFMLNPSTADAAERLSRALGDWKLRGICLFPAMHHYRLDDERVTATFEAAAARGAAVFVHCGVLTVGVRKKLGLPSPFDMRFSNPLDLHAIALRYPRTPFVVPHFGAGFLREALMLADLCPNVWLDTSSTNSWMRYEGVDLATVFQRALNVVGPSRLLFGTDSSFFPRGWNAEVFRAQAETLAGAGVSSSDARLIFGENLKSLFFCEVLSLLPGGKARAGGSRQNGGPRPIRRVRGAFDRRHNRRSGRPRCLPRSSPFESLPHRATASDALGDVRSADLHPAGGRQWRADRV